MASKTTTQGEFFGPDETGGFADGTVVINERCRIQSRGGYRVVSVSGLALAYYAVGDRMGEAHAMVSLVEQGWARQNEVATAFGCDVRTVRRNQRRFESGGLAALGRDGGYPKGVVRVRGSRRQLVNEWKAEGVANREIARRLGVSETAVRKLVRRLGWQREEGERVKQLTFDMGPPDANPNLSGSGSSLGIHEEAGSDQDTPQKTSPGANRDLAPSIEAGSETSPDANPNLSASSFSCAEPLPVSLDTDPLDRGVDRVMACLGLLEDAPPVFASGTQVPSVGALLAIPALVESGVFEVAAEVYGSIGPAFYGLRTSIVTLLLMALLRIKRPEALKEHSPRALGRVLGLDRAPDVKTLRRKLARLAAFDRAADFGRALAERRVASRGHALGFLYVDGHVRAYHGKRSLPKAHVARMRLAMPATTDYWVNDAEGEPLFVVTAEANAGLVKMLPVVLDEVRDLLGDRRVTVVFDRGGWSPKLFKQLIASGFDILTYRKGRSPRVPRSSFATHEADLEGRKLRYVLADTGVYLGYGPSRPRKRLHLRQVTRLSDDGHQTAVITSRRDLPAIEVAFRMFERWRQENFFKYLREEYALDALVDYGVEPGDATRDVPNPRRKELNAELRKAYVELNLLAAEYGAEAFTNLESARRTMRGFKIANADLGRRIHDALERVAALEKRRNSVPTRVPVKELTEGEVVKLRIERKHITDLVKMVAYQAEGDLVRLVSPHYRRAEDEGRTLIQSALTLAGDITPDGDELRVALEPLSSPHRTHALAALCEKLNETRTRFPGSRLRLRFEVKPPPETSLAFPGPRSNAAPEPPQPDISTRG
jgi:transposase